MVQVAERLPTKQEALSSINSIKKKEKKKKEKVHSYANSYISFKCYFKFPFFRELTKLYLLVGVSPFRTTHNYV